jgi:hypothetical protein
MAVVHRASIASVLLVAAMPAQQPASSKLQPTVPADRLVKLLELDEQRGKASMELWRLGKDAVPALMRALGDPRDEIVEAACAVLAEIGTEAAAAVPDLERLQASAKGRRQRALRWAWHGAGVTGIAVAEWGRGQIVLLDSKGNASGKVPALKGVWDAQPLPESHFLVTEVGSGKVRELDAKSNEVWHVDAPGAMSAQRLPSGNTLIASRDKSSVCELDPAGQEVASFRDLTGANACLRLADGTTIVGGQNEVTAVDPAGKPLWRYACQWAGSVRR